MPDGTPEIPHETPSAERNRPERPAARLRDGRPDWDAIDFDVLCSRCGYNLRMLVEPRCPECGLTFEWLELLDRTARRSPWLFEHRWRRRPVRSWLTTVWRSLRPWRFWSQVSIHDVIEPGPLWFLLLSCPAVFVVSLIGGTGLLIGATMAGTRVIPATGLSYSFGLAARQLWNVLNELVLNEDFPILAAAPLVVLLAILALVSSLRQTLGRCRIRPVQTLRVVAYVASPVCVVWAMLIVSIALLEPLLAPVIPMTATAVEISFLVGAVAVPVAYLSVGLRHYLHLPHAFPVALASCLIGWLCFLLAITVYALFK